MDVLADAASIASESISSHNGSPKAPSHSKKHKGEKLQYVLMKLLNAKAAPDAIWWLPGEKEFAINANLFPDQVLQVHFPGSKYASFIRRLHKLGFTRQTRSLKKVYGTLPAHAVAFRHDKFRKDKPELMDQLKNGYWKEAKKAKTVSKSGAASVSSSVSSHSPSPPSVVETVSMAPPVSTISLPSATLSMLSEEIKPVAAPSSGAHPLTVGLPGLPGAEAVSNQADLVLYIQELRRQREMEDELQRQQASAHQEHQAAETANADLLVYIQNLRRQREAEEELQRQDQERHQLGLLLLQQQEQQQFEELLFLQQQEQQRQQVELVLRRQLLAAGAQGQGQAPAAYNSQPTEAANASFENSLLHLQLLQQQALQQQQQQQQAAANPYLANANFAGFYY